MTPTGLPRSRPMMDEELGVEVTVVCPEPVADYDTALEPWGGSSVAACLLLAFFFGFICGG